jgi:hypothetical protein
MPRVFYGSVRTIIKQKMHSNKKYLLKISPQNKRDLSARLLPPTLTDFTQL